jgi:hypothetical protein
MVAHLGDIHHGEQIGRGRSGHNDVARVNELDNPSEAEAAQRPRVCWVGVVAKRNLFAVWLHEGDGV